jgi:predicted adenylyl cyclase CyaB
MMKNIEVELRSFITKEKYEELIDFFKQNSKFVNKDDQVTYYFDSKEDLRIQKNNFFSKIWLKKGKIHDESREEIEIKFDKEDFEIIERLFLVLGYNIEIKWFRKRYSFKWQDINVMLDYTRGYGYILELEEKSSEQEKDLVLNKLKEKLNSLNIELTPKEEFDKKFEYYKNNWKELIK